MISQSINPGLTSFVSEKQPIKSQPEEIFHKTFINFSPNKNQKSNRVKEKYRSIDPQILEKTTEAFLKSQYTNQFDISEKEHDLYCICPDCAYERNLAKPSHTLFNMTMRSIYQKEYRFPEKQIIEPLNLQSLNKTIDSFNGKLTNQKASSIHPKNTINLSTVYSHQMNGKHSQPKTKLIRNQDNLKFDGPFMLITSYRQKFSGVSGQNPHVRSLQKALNKSLRFNPTTTNSTFYKGQYTERSKLSKQQDQIKLGLPMLYKQSVSHKLYSSPQNPQKINRAGSKKVNTQKQMKNTKDQHQFETSYRKSFDTTKVYEEVKHKRKNIRNTLYKMGTLNI